MLVVLVSSVFTRREDSREDENTRNYYFYPSLLVLRQVFDEYRVYIDKLQISYGMYTHVYISFQSYLFFV